MGLISRVSSRTYRNSIKNMSHLLCIGNLPKFMHAKLEQELHKFFYSCSVAKVHLLQGQRFCFIEFKSDTGLRHAHEIMTAQAFSGKILRVENKNPAEFLDEN